MKVRLLGVIVTVVNVVFGQEVQLEDCLNRVEQVYPSSKYIDLSQRQSDLMTKALNLNFLPQLNVQAQGSYQTDVTELPFEIPNIELESMSKDQYKLMLEVNQLIFDAGVMSNKKKQIAAQNLIKKQEVLVGLYTIKEKVSGLFFNVLVIDERLKQLQTLTETLESTLGKLEVFLENGIVYRSSVNEVKVELIKNNQDVDALKSKRKSLVNILSALIEIKLSDDAVFKMPNITCDLSSNIRPELTLFKLQHQNIDLDKQQVKQHWLPKIDVFAKVGYARPGLNMLNNEFDTYAVGVVRLVVPLSGFYTQNNKIQILKVKHDLLEVNQETFLLNNKLKQIEVNDTLEMYKTQIKQDQELVVLSKDILQSAQAQLDNGVISSNEYIKKANDLYRAKLTMSLHEIQIQQMLHKECLLNGR